MTTTEFETAANETDALLLDTRDAQRFSKGFIPNSIKIRLDWQFAPWVGALRPNIKQPILLIVVVGKEDETITRLARVGYDNVIGYLKGDFVAWKNANKEIDTAKCLSAEVLETELNAGKPILIDVRKTTKYDAKHVEGAINILLDDMNNNLGQFPKKQPFITKQQNRL